MNKCALTKAALVSMVFFAGSVFCGTTGATGEDDDSENDAEGTLTVGPEFGEIGAVAEKACEKEVDKIKCFLETITDVKQDIGVGGGQNNKSGVHTPMREPAYTKTERNRTIEPTEKPSPEIGVTVSGPVESKERKIRSASPEIGGAESGLVAGDQKESRFRTHRAMGALNHRQFCEKGKVALVVFSTEDWCPPCKALARHAQKWLDCDQELVFYDVDMRGENLSPLGMTGEQFGLMTDNGLKGFPSALMLGKNCEIVGKLLGYNEIVETLDRRCASDHMGSEKKL